MKKITMLLFVFLLVAGMLSVPVCAANKSDLLKEAAKSPVYKYIGPSLENAAKTVVITDEQADKILPIIQKAVSIVPEDHGATYENPGVQYYTEEQFNEVMECIDEICTILNYSYKFTPVAKPAHPGDVSLQIFDSNGKLIFEYDGDAVKKTSAAAEVDTRVILVAGVVVLAVGAVSLVLAKKRLSAR